MNFEDIKKYVINNPQSNIAKFLIFGYNGLYGLILFLCTLTGYIPSHIVRFFLYKYLFKVKVGYDSTIYWRCRFFDPYGVHIGHNTIIGNDAFLDGRKGIFIGNNVNIAGECRIYTLEHDISSPTFGIIGGPVYINDYVYVGSRVTILPGVTIGEGAVLASGCVVTNNIEPWTLVGGVPAKFIKSRPIVKYSLNTRNKVMFQ